jgi:hypothetical protein
LVASSPGQGAAPTASSHLSDSMPGAVVDAQRATFDNRSAKGAGRRLGRGPAPAIHRLDFLTR